jgi:murein DD-endopeptidase MepM/ murein hydrolase activator NlpD
VEKRFFKNRFSGYGRILAAQFTNQGRTHKAFFHKTADGTQGYYDAQGHAIQKAFLKAPLSFSRISSGFSMRRLHPILNEYHPHPAIDYAAPEGTPVKTVGDGVVAAMGYSKTMGNHVTIRHAAGYVTRYWHLSGFAPELYQNHHVAQGQLIGFVGQTGYATGPHLDFRITKHGQPVNPLTYETPSARPVPAEEMSLFLSRIDRLDKELSGTPALAMGKTP